ncbi:MAG TPA: hypothetical protein VGM84_05030 [Steroidobacteraceae bacterium]|jgi:hypothetical protein
MFSSSTTATTVRGAASVVATHRRGISRAIQIVAISLLVIEMASPGVSGAATGFCGNRRCGVTTPTLPPKILSYEVTLNSLELVSTTGVKAEVLSEPMEMDLAQVIDLEDAINTGLIPAGTYVTANVVIDYAHANITADDGTGKAVKLMPLDSSGAPISGTEAVTMKLDRNRSFTVSIRNGALQALDFNLEASTQVSIANATAKVAPTLVANVVPSGNTWVTIRGAFTSADPTNNDFVLTVPRTRAVNAVVRGPIKVELSPTTTYVIYGASYTAANGEPVLEALPAGTNVSVVGSLHTDRATIVASSIVATQP